jgi:PAS domain-containing protein
VIGQAVPRVITIPSADSAFRQHVERLRAAGDSATAALLETRLRRLFPRVLVRERELSGEPPAWYVYRDGGWQSSVSGPWWGAAGLPRVTVSQEGWLTEANPTACGLFGIDPTELGTHHFTDFAVPGALDDSQALFRIIDEGHDLTATILLRPTNGETVAVDIHATREGTSIVGLFRLAEGVPIRESPATFDAPELVCLPATDVAFRGYAEMALSRMPEPDPDGLALRLRRLYPHARVEVEGGRWTVSRDAAGLDGTATGWWLDTDLPRVRYDAQALILDANEAAQQLLGARLAGRYWQEFVTPGSTEQVSAMLAILAEVGAAESRFRMPAADGSLVEFDSYTQVDGESFTTVMRPRH